MAIVLIVLASIAVVQKKSSDLHRTKKVNADKTLLENIDLNTITELDIIDGSNKITVAKNDEVWKVTSLYNYPADFQKLATSIQRTSQVKLGEPVPAGNIDKSEFGLDKNAKQIILKAGNKKILALKVGVSRDASKTVGWANQRFITKSGDDSIYLVNDDFGYFLTNNEGWIKKDLLKVNSGDIVAITSKDIKLKLNGTDWKLDGIKKNQELDTSKLSKLKSVLQYLSCKSIADPAKSENDIGMDNPEIYTATTKDGFTYTVKTGKPNDEGDVYAQFAVKYDRPTVPSKPEKDAADDKKTAYENELKQYNETVAANEKKATELNDRLSRWTYILDKYQAEAFLLTHEKLVKEKEKKSDRKKKRQTEGLNDKIL